MVGEYKLSASLNGHSSDVRAVLHPHQSFALTASRDGSTKLWKSSQGSPPTFDAPDELSSGTQFKTCLTYLPPSREYPDGLVISAGQDTLIEARQPSTTAEQNADAMLVGHSNQVCSLDVSERGDWIVSGSWDSTAKVWSVGKWEVEVELENHTATVWAVLAYDRDTIITGCADRGIRRFTASGKQIHGWEGKEVVRALCKLGHNHETTAQIASGTNDGVVRLWRLDGTLIGECYGHEAFIYSLATLPTGEIVSSGEDRSVRIWQGTACKQVITIPAISIWSVSACVNGDIIVGSSDKMARIFTRSQDRIASAELLQEFDESLQNSALPKQQVGDIKTSDLPGPEFLTRKSGTKEGQTVIIKDQGGQPTVYQWSTGQQQWLKVGQVVDSAGTSQKIDYLGKQYDYVFDVDIEDGKPPLKLPFNVTENPYEAATKFLQDNELPMSYLEETANFIIKNSQGAQIGAQESSGGVDAWGTENRYRPGEPPQAAYAPPAPTESAARSTLPQKEYLSIVLGKPSAAMGQINKLNNTYAASNSTEALSPADLEAISSLARSLDEHHFQSMPSMNSSQIEQAIAPILKIISMWQPLKNRLAALDLLRFSAAACSDFPVPEDDSLSDLFSSSIFDAQTVSENSKLAMVGYRCFANLIYGSEAGRVVVQVFADDVLNHLQVGADSINSSSDANFANALTTLCVNMAVLLVSEKTDQSEKQASRLIGILVQILVASPTVDHSSQNALSQTTEPAFRALMALGTIILGFKSSEEVKKLAKSRYHVEKVIGTEGLRAKKYLEEPRFKRVVGEIQRALK